MAESVYDPESEDLICPWCNPPHIVRGEGRKTILRIPKAEAEAVRKSHSYQGVAYSSTMCPKAQDRFRRGV